MLTKAEIFSCFVLFASGDSGNVCHIEWPIVGVGDAISPSGRLALGMLEDRVFCVLTLKEDLLLVLALTTRGGSSSIAGVRGVKGVTLEREEGSSEYLVGRLVGDRLRVDIFKLEVLAKLVAEDRGSRKSAVVRSSSGGNSIVGRMVSNWLVLFSVRPSPKPTGLTREGVGWYRARGSKSLENRVGKRREAGDRLFWGMVGSVALRPR